jgi:hypothetical protein
MQQDSACRRQFAFKRSGVAGLTRNWKPLAMMVAITWWPGGILANDSDGFSPHLFLIVDESGSMKGRQDWVADVLPALGHALNERNLNTLPDQIDFTLAGFTTHSRELAQHASDIEAARAVRALRTNGGTEDGYVAIHNVLSEYLAGVDYTPTTVVLITDENRDVTDRDLTLTGLADQLVTNGIVVHAVIKAQIVCPDRQWGIAVDKDRVAVIAGRSGLSTCSNARIRTFDDYAELAWATGGLVWNLNALSEGQPDPLRQFVETLSDAIISQWPPGALWADIDYSPKDPRPGDVVTFDGSNSFSSQPDGQIVYWAWDLDGDGTVDQDGPIVANIFSVPGRYRIVLNITDDSMPSSAGRKVLLLQVSEKRP